MNVTRESLLLAFIANAQPFRDRLPGHRQFPRGCQRESHSDLLKVYFWSLCQPHIHVKIPGSTCGNLYTNCVPQWKQHGPPRRQKSTSSILGGKFWVETEWDVLQSDMGKRREGLGPKDPNRKSGSALPGCVMGLLISLVLVPTSVKMVQWDYFPHWVIMKNKWWSIWKYFYFYYNCIYLFLAVLGLRCCMDFSLVVVSRS